MIAVDTQILVHAHRAESAWHEPARKHVTDLAESGARWGIPMHCLVEFYAKVTHARLYRPPSTPAQALVQIDSWLASPGLTVLADDAQTWTTARDLLTAARVRGNATYDARIAAVCLRYGVAELWTDDRDFLLFPALRARNPLIDIPGRAEEPRAAWGATAGGRATAARPPRPGRGGARRRSR